MSKKYYDDITKLKHWVDSEFSVLHIYALVIMLLVTEGLVPNLIIGTLIAINVVYALKRVTWIVKVDKKYLKVPKNETH